MQDISEYAKVLVADINAIKKDFKPADNVNGLPIKEYIQLEVVKETTFKFL